MATDPRATLVSWFGEGGKITRANLMFDSDGDGTDETHAVFTARYEASEENLEQDFLTDNVHVIFVVGKDRVDPVDTASGTVGYKHHVWVEAAIIDQWASGGGSLSLNAPKLQWQAEQEIRRVLRENAASASSIKMDSSAMAYHRLGSTILYSPRYSIVVTEWI